MSGQNKWFGGVLAGSGKIYSIPLFSTSVLIVDPVTNTADTTTITGLSTVWAGGVLAESSRKIYGIPYSSTSVLFVHQACEKRLLLIIVMNFEGFHLSRFPNSPALVQTRLDSWIGRERQKCNEWVRTVR